MSGTSHGGVFPGSPGSPLWVWMIFCLIAGPLQGLPTFLGDFDEDGRLTSRDVVALVNHLNGVEPLPADLVPFADVNGDGLVNSSDVDRLAESVVGLTAPRQLQWTGIRSTSPASGESQVAVTRETVLFFSQPLSASTILTPAQIHADFGERRLLTRAELSSDRRKATLFYLENLPGGSRIRVTFDANGLLDAYGRALDGDGDGQPGGVFQMDFDTLSLTPLAGTAVIGRVFASELAPGGSPNQSVNVPLAGVTITLDGKEETVRAVTDTMGNFRLEPVPVGDFFVHIDGRTAVPYDPTQAYYPFVGKKWASVARAETPIGNVYLPLVKAGTLQPVSALQPTVVNFPEEVLQEHPELEGVSLTVPPNSLFSDSGARGGRVGIAPVPPDRLPGPLPQGLNPPLVITIQTDGPMNLDTPAPICFPNLPDPVTGATPPPGSKLALLSFNHDTGEWENAGPMTVSGDGKFICTDPGVGILQPGWHTTSSTSSASGGDITDEAGDPPAEATATAAQEGGSDDEDADSTCKDGCPTGGGGEARPSQTKGAVLLHSGEERFDRVDLSIPGRAGLDFVLQRRYRSRLAYNGPMGHGWDFNYNEHLYLRPDGELTRRNGGGRLDSWQPGAGDNFDPPKGNFRALQREPDGTYVLRSPDGFKRLYRADGRLYAYMDRHGNRMLFDYDAAGNLSRVIDVFGREIRFIFERFPDRVHRLVRVVDFTGRVVRYGYDHRGDLVEVTTPAISGTSTGNDFPQGRTERYVYALGQAHPDLNHNLVELYRPAEVASGGPPSMRWSYGTNPSDPLTFDRVLSLTEGGVNESGVPSGGTTTYLYEALNTSLPPGNPDLPRGRVTVTDPVGNRVENYGNELGHHLMTRVLTRGLRTNDPPHFETRTFHTPDGQRIRTIYPAGNEVRFKYDDTGSRAEQKNLIEIRHVADTARGGGPDRVTQFAYEPLFNQLASITDARGLDPSYVPPLGTASPERYTTRFHYDYQESSTPVPEAVRFGISLAGVPRGLGDLNSDGRTDQVTGNLVRTTAPSVQLPADSMEAARLGSTLQPGVTEQRWNDRGQLLATVDAEGNLHTRTYYPENDPDGDGLLTFAPFMPVRSKAYGYLATEIRDAGPTPRRRTQSPPTVLTSHFRYDPAGHLVAVRNPRGIWTELEFNARDEVVAVIRGAHVADAIAAGELLTGESPRRYLVRFHYDANGRLVRKETENRDSTTTGVGDLVERRIDYDILGRPIRYADEIGAGAQRIAELRYDANGRLSQHTLPEGNLLTYVHDERNLLWRVTRGAGTPEASTSSIDYDANGNRHRIVDAADSDGDGLPETAHFIYDGFDRLRSILGPLGRETRYTYDPVDNRLTLEVHGHPPATPAAPAVLLQETRFLHDELRRVFRVDGHLFLASGYDTARPVDLRDANSDGWVSMHIERDSLSRATFVREDDGEMEERVYDGASRLVERIDALGNARQLEHDANGNVVAVTEIEQPSAAAVPAESRTSIYVYDQLDRMIRSTDHAGQTARFAYDSHDNLVRRSDAQGAPAADPLGLFPRPAQSGVINTPGNTRRWVHDGLGRLRREEIDLLTGAAGSGTPDLTNPENPDGLIAISYDYDANSRLLTIRDDRGHATSFDYDALDRMIRRRLPDGSTSSFDYDADDNLRQTTDPNGTRTQWTYDALNRVTRCQVTPGAGVGGTTEQLFDYDGLSRLVRSADNNSGFGAPMVSEFVFDSLGRVLEERQNGLPISSVWTGDGRRLSSHYPGGRRLDYGHDALDRMASIKDGNDLLFEAAWMGTGYRELTRTFGNGAALTYLNPTGDAVTGYDAVRRITRLQHLLPDGTPFVDRSYAYNRAGHRTHESRHDDSGFTDIATYDSAYRLVATEFDTGGSGGMARDLRRVDYQLDGIGNRRREVNLPAAGAPITIQYGVDTLSAYTSVAGVARAHAPNGNLIDDGSRTYQYDFRNRLTTVRTKAGGSLIARYAYFADDRRARKQVLDPASSTVLEDTQFLYDNWQVCEERDANGSTQLTYVWGPKGVDDLVSGDRTAAHPLGPGRFYTHQNDRGDVVGVTDEPANLVEKIVYDDFGLFTVLPSGGGAASQSLAGNPYFFQGARYDPETGLYYFRSRHYDPRHGRFLQRDPEWDLLNHANPYNYPGHNPVAFSDPSGRSGVCKAVADTVLTAAEVIGIADVGFDLYSQGASMKDDAKDVLSGSETGYETATSALAAAKAATDVASVVGTVDNMGYTSKAAGLYEQGQRGIQAARAGVTGVAGSTPESLADISAQARSANNSAKAADKLAKGANVAGGVVDAAAAAFKQAETNAKDRKRQDENTSQYFNSLDEINDHMKALSKKLDQMRKCGKKGSPEYNSLLDRMEALHRAARSAGEAFDASESARETHFLADTVENGVTGVVGRLPVVGSTAAALISWFSNP